MDQNNENDPKPAPTTSEDGGSTSELELAPKDAPGPEDDDEGRSTIHPDPESPLAFQILDTLRNSSCDIAQIRSTVLGVMLALFDGNVEEMNEGAVQKSKTVSSSTMKSYRSRIDLSVAKKPATRQPSPEITTETDSAKPSKAKSQIQRVSKLVVPSKRELRSSTKPQPSEDDPGKLYCQPDALNHRFQSCRQVRPGFRPRTHRQNCRSEKTKM
jgi:hypothetical protein